LPLPAVAQQSADHPRLFLTLQDFARIRKLAEDEPWATKEKEEIVQEANAFPESYERQFGSGESANLAGATSTAAT